MNIYKCIQIKFSILFILFVYYTDHTLRVPLRSRPGDGDDGDDGDGSVCYSICLNDCKKKSPFPFLCVPQCNRDCPAQP